MRVAVLGRGKTGIEVVNLCREGNIPHKVFSTECPVSEEGLKGCDVGVSFLPGPVFVELAPLLAGAGLPVVNGGTGADLPEGFVRDLERRKLAWIQGRNFSLGMNLAAAMIRVLSKTPRLFETWRFGLHEVHHLHKRDAPSGTALKWGQWLGLPVEVTSERRGDEVGRHQLTLEVAGERITLCHQALERKIFARGAVWAAKYLNERDPLPGLHWFEDIAGELL